MLFVVTQISTLYCWNIHIRNIGIFHLHWYKILWTNRYYKQVKICQFFSHCVGRTVFESFYIYLDALINTFGTICTFMFTCSFFVRIVCVKSPHEEIFLMVSCRKIYCSYDKINCRSLYSWSNYTFIAVSQEAYNFCWWILWTIETDATTDTKVLIYTVLKRIRESLTIHSSYSECFGIVDLSLWGLFWNWQKMIGRMNY